MTPMNEIPQLPAQPSGTTSGSMSGSMSGSIGQVGRAQPGGKTAGAKPNGPAFEVLLERLTTRAAELEEKSKTLSEPADLPGAVDAARSSLEDALALGEELMEAYRAAQQHAPEAAP